MTTLKWRWKVAGLADVVQAGQPIVGQIEAWAQAQGVNLDEHWKVPLSIKVKQRMLTRGLNAIPHDFVDRWVGLFEHSHHKTHNSDVSIRSQTQRTSASRPVGRLSCDEAGSDAATAHGSFVPHSRPAGHTRFR